MRTNSSERIATLFGLVIASIPAIASADGPASPPNTGEWSISVARACPYGVGEGDSVHGATYSVCGAVFDRASHAYRGRARQVETHNDERVLENIPSPDRSLRASALEDDEGTHVQIVATAGDGERVVANVALVASIAHMMWLSSDSLLLDATDSYFVLRRGGSRTHVPHAWQAPGGTNEYIRARRSEGGWHIVDEHELEIAAYSTRPDDTAFFYRPSGRLEEVRISQSEANEFANQASLRTWAQAVLARYALTGTEREAVAFVRDGKRTLRASWRAGSCVVMSHSLEVTENGPTLVRVEVVGAAPVSMHESHVFLQRIPTEVTRIPWEGAVRHDPSIGD